MTAADIAIIAWEVVGCILMADVITGLGHWTEDTYLTLQTPVLGKLIAFDNVDHHRRPTFMARMGTLISRNVYQFVMFGMAWVPTWLICRHYGASVPWQFYVVGFAASLGNELHAWTHMKSRNWAIRLLHDTCLVITPRSHNVGHHRPPYDKCFCTITNVMNPILDGIGLWRGLEWSIGLFGIRPKRMSPERDGY